MNVRVFDDPGAVAQAAADLVHAAAARRPDLALGLPTGHTPIGLYDELAARHARGTVDLSQARGFNLDELVLPASDPRTFRQYMMVHTWDRTGLDRKRCDLPDGEAADLGAECRRYERAVADAGGLDLAILGLGIDGHVAYNLPGPFVRPTHVVTLPDATADSLGLGARERPLRAITMGLGTIRAARAILVLATGPSKSRAVQALVQGPVSEDWPCSFLRDHSNIELLLDRPAAAGL